MHANRHGIYCFRMFSLVTKLNSMRAILSLTTYLNWPLFQLDAKNSFLYGELQEEVYMKLLPEIFLKDNKSGKA